MATSAGYAGLPSRLAGGSSFTTIVAGVVSMVLALFGSHASAQAILAGGGAQVDVQRFSGDSDLNRLDGAAGGWTAFGGATLRSRLALRVEGSFGRDIVDIQRFTVDIDGRSASIESSLVHRSRSIAALGGYSYPLTTRVRLVALAGISFTHVQRTFTTNAPGVVLVSPSFPAVAQALVLANHFHEFAAGADMIALLAHHVAIVAGLRAQPLDITADLTGFSIRPLVGAAWMF